MERLRTQLIYGLGPFAPKVEDAAIMAGNAGRPQEVDIDPFAQAGIY
jgi:hypothetical protein